MEQRQSVSNTLSHVKDQNAELFFTKKNKKDLGATYLKEKAPILQQLSIQQEINIQLCFESILHIEKAMHFFDLNRDIKETRFAKKQAAFQQPMTSQVYSNNNLSSINTNKNLLNNISQLNKHKQARLYFENEEPTFDDINKLIGSFLLFGDFDELHYMFLDFTSLFDENQNFIIERSEFQEILTFMIDNEYMDSMKMEKLIKALVGVKEGINFKKSHHKENKVSDFYKEELFQAFSKLVPKARQKGKTKLQADEVIDFLRFFPVFFSFFLEFTKKRLQIRKYKMLQIIGIEFNPFKKDVNENDLLDIKRENYIQIKTSYTLIIGFNQIGYDYFNEKHRLKKDLTFKQIELVVIQYKNANSQLYCSNSIHNILQDLMKYLKVDPITNLEKKRKPFGKIILWLALKLGIHSCLSNLKRNMAKKDIFRYKEEIILWNCVQFSMKLNGDLKFGVDSQNKGLFSYLTKLNMDQGEFNQKQWQQILDGFLKKKFSLILDPSIERIAKSFYYGKGNKTQGAGELCSQIYHHILEEIEYKLKYYLNKTFIAFGADPDPNFLRKNARLGDNFNVNGNGNAQNPQISQNLQLFNNPSMMNLSSSNQTKAAKNSIKQTNSPFPYIHGNPHGSLKKNALSKFLNYKNPSNNPSKKQGLESQEFIPEEEEEEKFEFGIGEQQQQKQKQNQKGQFMKVSNQNEKERDRLDTETSETSQKIEKTRKIQERQEQILNQQMDYLFLNLLNPATGGNSSFSQQKQSTFKRNTNNSNRNTQTMNSVNLKDENNQQIDIVQSCFIMENFLEKFLYLRKHEINVKHYDEKKKNRESSKDIYGNIILNTNNTKGTESDTLTQSQQQYGGMSVGNKDQLLALAQGRKNRYITTSNSSENDQQFTQRSNTESQQHTQQDYYKELMGESGSSDYIQSQVSLQGIQQNQYSMMVSSNTSKFGNNTSNNNTSQQMDQGNSFYFLNSMMHQDLYDDSKEDFDYKQMVDVIQVVKKKNQVKKGAQEQVMKCAIMNSSVPQDEGIIYEFGFLVERLQDSSVMGLGFGYPQEIQKNSYVFNDKQGDNMHFYGLFNDGGIQIMEKNKHSNQFQDNYGKIMAPNLKFKMGDVVVLQIDFAIKKMNFLKISLQEMDNSHQNNNRGSISIRNRDDYRNSQFNNPNQPQQQSNQHANVQFYSIDFKEVQGYNFYVTCILSKIGDKIQFLGQKSIIKNIYNVSIQERLTKANYLKSQIQVNKNLQDIEEQQFYKLHAKNRNKNDEIKKTRDCTCEIF